MSLHLSYNHQCPKCKAYYIPYNEEVPCPNCGLIEKERFNFIPQALDSIAHNLSRAGTFLGLSWSTLSLADHILLNIFQALEAFRQKEGKKDFATFIKEILSKADWGEHKYLEKHIYSILLRIYEELPKEVFTLKGGELKEYSENLYFKYLPNKRRREIEEEIKRNIPEIIRILQNLTQISEQGIRKEIEKLLKEIETTDPFPDPSFIGTREIEKELVEKAKEDDEAKKELIRVNLGLIIMLAVIGKRYGSQKLSLIDLIWEAFSGILDLIQQFDFKKYSEGVGFSIYARDKIQNNLLKFIGLEGDFRWD